MLMLAAVLPAAETRAAQPQADAGRAVLARYADAIVGVELVVTLKMKMGDREAPPREQRVEVNGTVISPTGLTVTTLAEVDPQATIEMLRAGAGPGARGMDIMGSEFKEVKLRLADGREVPARFVLKDADLDLAFMAPETDEPGRTFPHVKLEEAAEGRALDTFFYVARASKTLQRAPLVRRSEVMGLVEKPRRFYLLTEQTPGTPVFDPAGKVLGITLQHFANGRRTGLVVLPAADIAEMAKQAAAVQVKPAAP
jgi:S1-C subfamily serine protease